MVRHSIGMENKGTIYSLTIAQARLLLEADHSRRVDHVLIITCGILNMG